MHDRPVASVSINLDNLWTYLRTRGDAAWESRPSFLRTFLPLALDTLDGAGIRVTFFIVGRDAAEPENAEVFREVTRRGHEVGNHSYDHAPSLQRLSRAELDSDVARGEEAITRATGHRPVGFRGPAYSWSAALLDVLERRGYRYDATALPTYLGPLARAYYFRAARLGPEERAKRRELFGTFRDGIRPIKPYWWLLGDGRALLEIPITTLPGIKTPFHLSYLLYLSRYSERLAVSYLKLAVAACRVTGTEPSFVLHPLDLLGPDQVPELRFFPGMDLSGEHKQRVFRRVIEVLDQSFSLVTMGAHAAALGVRWSLRALYPSPIAVPPPDPRL